MEEKHSLRSAEKRYYGSLRASSSRRTGDHLSTQKSHELFSRLRRRAVSRDLGEIMAGDFRVVDFVNPASDNTESNDPTSTGVWRTWEYYFVLAMISVGTAMVAVFMDISVSFLRSMRYGICVHAPMLSREVCCEGTKFPQGCTTFRTWGEIIRGTTGTSFDVAIPIVAAVLFVCCSAWLVQRFAPYAAGSGIPEVKAILNGTVMSGFLSEWTFVIKAVGLALAVASGLNVGKEGPFVHLSSCLAYMVCKLLHRSREDQSLMRETICCACAAGVAVAFAAPIGGVLFALEEASSYFPNHVIWRSFFCATLAMLVLMRTNPFFNDKLVLFEVKYDLQWFWFEMIAFALLGALGGVVGHFFTYFNIRYQRNKRKIFSFTENRDIVEVFIVIVLTQIADAPVPFLGLTNNQILEGLFHSCQTVPVEEVETGREVAKLICDRRNRSELVQVLTYAVFNKFVLSVITFGVKVPAGLFIPSLTIGACLGRLVGVGVHSLHESYPENFMFRECTSASTCVDTAIYAIIGAAGVLAGVTQVSVSLCVIVFELTGGLTHLLPVMVAVLTAKLVTNWFGVPSIYEGLIHTHRYPFLDVDMDLNTISAMGARTCARDIMRMNMQVISSRFMRLSELESLLTRFKYNGFPVVNNFADKQLIGYISRTQLWVAIKDHRETGAAASTRVSFLLVPPATEADGDPEDHPVAAEGDAAHRPFEEPELNPNQELNFSEYMDRYVPTVFEDTKIPEIYRLFAALGNRYCCVVSRGQLVGLISKKDLLAYLDVKDNLVKYFL